MNDNEKQSEKTDEKNGIKKQRRKRSSPWRMMWVERRILELLSESEELTARKIALKTKTPKMTVYNKLERLVAAGRLEYRTEEKTKYYRLHNRQQVKVEGEAPQGKGGDNESLGCGAQ